MFNIGLHVHRPMWYSSIGFALVCKWNFLPNFSRSVLTAHEFVTVTLTLVMRWRAPVTAMSRVVHILAVFAKQSLLLRATTRPVAPKWAILGALCDVSQGQCNVYNINGVLSTWPMSIYLTDNVNIIIIA